MRQVAEKRLYATVAGAARRADASLPADLVALLGVPEGRRVSELERLQAALVYVDTLMVQDVLADDEWAARLTPAVLDTRGPCWT